MPAPLRDASWMSWIQAIFLLLITAALIPLTMRVGEVGVTLSKLTTQMEFILPVLPETDDLSQRVAVMEQQWVHGECMCCDELERQDTEQQRLQLQIDRIEARLLVQEAE